MSRNCTGSTSNCLRFAGDPGTTGWPLAISAWVKIANTTGYKPIAAVNKPGAGDSVILSINGANALCQATNGGVGISATSAGSVATDAWQHLLAVVVSNTLRCVYLNGVRTNDVAGGTSLTYPGPFTRTSAGGEERFTPLAFTGDIAEVTFWKSSLNQELATKLANGLWSRLIDPDNILAYYSCWTAITATTGEVDQVGSSHLTVTGSVGSGTGHPTIYIPRAGGRLARLYNHGAI